jgi:DNA-binding NarL/FixJ family response regulator
VERKLSVFVLSSTRLLRESIERMVRKKSDLDLKKAGSIRANSKDDVTASGAEILVTDSLQFILVTKGWGAAAFPTERERIKVVLVAMDDDRKHFLNAVKQGVLGYVLQEAPAIEVLNAIRAAARGEAVCPPHFVRALFDYVASQFLDRPNARTQTQMGPDAPRTPVDSLNWAGDDQ